MSPKKRFAASELSITEISQSQNSLSSGNMLRGIRQAKTIMAGQARAQTRLHPRDIEEETANIANLIHNVPGVAIFKNPRENVNNHKNVHQAIVMISYTGFCQEIRWRRRYIRGELTREVQRQRPLIGMWM